MPGDDGRCHTGNVDHRRAEHGRRAGDEDLAQAARAGRNAPSELHRDIHVIRSLRARRRCRP